MITAGVLSRWIQPYDQALQVIQFRVCMEQASHLPLSSRTLEQCLRKNTGHLCNSAQDGGAGEQIHRRWVPTLVW